MNYKNEFCIIKKEELCKNKIIRKTLTLCTEEKAVIKGQINNNSCIPLEGCGIVLIETDEKSGLQRDVKTTFTDENGRYYITFKPKSKKLYNIAVYINVDS